jgi:hypothetical protein
MKPEVLINKQRAKKPKYISGAGDVQFVVYDIVYLQDFFPICASDNTNANVLSLVKVEDIHPKACASSTSFTVHFSDLDGMSKRSSKQYIADGSGLYDT